MIWETLGISQSRKPLAGNALLEKFTLERRLNVAGNRPMEEEVSQHGGATRSGEGVDSVHRTHSTGEVAWNRETQWCLEGDLGMR